MALAPHEKTILALLPGVVAVSSVAGLNRAVELFFPIWAANLWGDLVFILGTGATLVYAVRAGRRTRPVVAFFVAAALTWLTYVLSFFLTFGAMDPDGLRFHDVAFARLTAFQQLDTLPMVVGLVNSWAGPGSS